jgi:hypothetical protein
MVKQLYLEADLEDQICRFIRNKKTETDVEKNREFQYLLKILPETLSKRLSQFLFHNAITNIPFLQNRRSDFYAKYLHQLDYQLFYKEEVISR